ncbi:hypothetical protein CC78DRAFT_531657 [Lojkania enalia]|uniref:N-alpha-acetyltransferase 40 n=1 Tax=Lojkania enalia TaxID=147567 RepID=A0A9P4N7E5_9PLEO|nr:hypothetical protein CC78DRAFT_531657 [Didymosphaeria enalia]
MVNIGKTLINEKLPDDDPLLAYTPPCEDGLSVYITRKQSSRLTLEEFKACYNLIRLTSSAHYKASSVGWVPSEKRKEMKHEHMWYLLVRKNVPKPNLEAINSESRADWFTSSEISPQPAPPAQPGPVVGFLSLMFTHDDYPNDKIVCYIYEVHLGPSLRGSGLGSHLITVAETLAKRCGIGKTMLTVFGANTKARRLYERLGYVKDPSSPEDRVVRRRNISAEYRILSKRLEA